MIFFAYVSRRFRYRVREDVLNWQYLIEEIYEREFKIAAELEEEEELEEDAENEMLINSNASVQQYN